MYTLDDYALYMSTNVTSFFRMTLRTLEFMGKQGRGHVVTITTSLADPADEQRPGRVGLSYKRSAERRDKSACNRVCEDRRSRQRRVTGNN
jgi:NAD(P)-dependent dehydrogenase (short-subunit alcohol dehydrogenase family)